MPYLTPLQLWSRCVLACSIVYAYRYTLPRKYIHIIGQAGLSSRGNGDYGIVTYVHNIMTDGPTDSEPARSILEPRVVSAILPSTDEFEPYFESMCTPALAMPKLRLIILREGTEEVDRVEWKFGLDLVWGESQEPQDSADILHHHDRLPFDPSRYAFEIVGRSFPYMVGLKIAVVIYTEKEPTCTNVDFLEPKEGSLTQVDLESIFGFAGSTNIYTGSITQVGDLYIMTISIHTKASREPLSFCSTGNSRPRWTPKTTARSSASTQGFVGVWAPTLDSRSTQRQKTSNNRSITYYTL